jgi:hypothetical protein
MGWWDLLSLMLLTNNGVRHCSAYGVEHDFNEGERLLLPKPPLLPKPQPPKSFTVDQQYEGIGIRDDINLTGKYLGYLFPPFPAGAASRTTLVAGTRGSIEIRTKRGILLYRGSKFSFFQFSGPINATQLTGPLLTYDEYEDRFIVITTFWNVFNSTVYTNSSIHVAVSKTGSPVGPGDWYIQSINSTGYNSTQDEYPHPSINCKTHRGVM